MRRVPASMVVTLAADRRPSFQDVVEAVVRSGKRSPEGILVADHDTARLFEATAQPRSVADRVIVDDSLEPNQFSLEWAP